MLLLGAVVNSLAVVLGGSIGLLLKKGLPAKVGETIMSGLALCVFYIGISGSLLIIGVVLNMLKVTNLKIMNYVPAIFFIIIFCLF